MNHSLSIAIILSLIVIALYVIAVIVFIRATRPDENDTDVVEIGYEAGQKPDENT